MHLRQPQFTYSACGPFTFNTAKDPKYDGHQRGLAFMVYKFFDKKSEASGVNTKLAPQN